MAGDNEQTQVAMYRSCGGRFLSRRIIKGKGPEMGTNLARLEIRRMVRVDGYRGGGRGKEEDVGGSGWGLVIEGRGLCTRYVPWGKSLSEEQSNVQRGQVELENTVHRVEVRFPSFPHKPAFYVGFSILVRISPFTDLSGLRTSVSSGFLLSLPSLSTSS